MESRERGNLHGLLPLTANVAGSVTAVVPTMTKTHEIPRPSNTEKRLMAPKGCMSLPYPLNPATVASRPTSAESWQTMLPRKVLASLYTCRLPGNPRPPVTNFVRAVMAVSLIVATTVTAVVNTLFYVERVTVPDGKNRRGGDVSSDHE